jgi:hypothetical protein
MAGRVNRFGMLHDFLGHDINIGRKDSEHDGPWIFDESANPPLHNRVIICSCESRPPGGHGDDKESEDDTDTRS